MKLTSKQRKFLRSKAHHLKPVVLIGKFKLNDSTINAIEESLNSHELIKVKFNQHKDLKKEIIYKINRKADSQSIGLIGNIAIIFRQNIDPEKRIYNID